jgi:hypothetical protein
VQVENDEITDNLNHFPQVQKAVSEDTSKQQTSDSESENPVNNEAATIADVIRPSEKKPEPGIFLVTVNVIMTYDCHCNNQYLLFWCQL